MRTDRDGERERDRYTLASIWFGPVKLGAGRLGGAYTPGQVIAELRRNGAGRFALTPEGRVVLPAQGVRT